MSAPTIAMVELKDGDTAYINLNDISVMFECNNNVCMSGMEEYYLTLSEDSFKSLVSIFRLNGGNIIDCTRS